MSYCTVDAVPTKYCSCQMSNSITACHSTRACPCISRVCCTLSATCVPLHSTGAADCVHYLLKRNASVNIQDKIGITPLHLAARNGSVSPFHHTQPLLTLAPSLPPSLPPSLSLSIPPSFLYVIFPQHAFVHDLSTYSLLQSQKVCSKVGRGRC